MTRFKLNRTIELAIGVVLFIVVAYVTSVSFKVLSGVSKELKTPQHQIRLQVLNGCGVRGVASKVADKLAGYFDEDIEIMIVDTDNFNLTEIPESFLILRSDDKQSAELLSEKLGLDSDAIEERQMENNFRHVTITLVLGADYETVGFDSTQEGESSN